MSMARRFSSHARLSSLPTNCAVQPSFRSLPRSCSSFWAGEKPAYSSGRIHAGVSGRAGRPSVHSSSSRRSVRMEAPFFSSAFFRPFTRAVLAVRPHRPSTSPSFRALAQYSSTVGTPGSPMRCSSISVPASSFSACTKYRPSAHRALPVRVTTRLEFSPWNPENQVRLV